MPPDSPTTLPDDRAYETAAEARLDETIVDAIALADEIGSRGLATLLRLCLRTHYWATRN